MSKTNKNTMDMTHGTLWNKILIFALPLHLRQAVFYSSFLIPLIRQLSDGLPAVRHWRQSAATVR